MLQTFSQVDDFTAYVSHKIFNPFSILKYLDCIPPANNDEIYIFMLIFPLKFESFSHKSNYWVKSHKRFEGCGYTWSNCFLEGVFQHTVLAVPVFALPSTIFKLIF